MVSRVEAVRCLLASTMVASMVTRDAKLTITANTAALRVLGVTNEEMVQAMRMEEYEFPEVTG